MDIMCLKWILIQAMLLVNLFYKGEANTFLFLLLLLFFTLKYCIGFAIHQHSSITGVSHP